MKRLLPCAALAVLLAGCDNLRFPGVHRITVQQGNVVTQQMIDRLKPGMTRSQVRFIMGNPVLVDPLDQDRWDYIYTFQLTGGGPRLRRVLSLYFLEDKLSYFEGHFLPTEAAEEIAAEAAASN